MVQFISELLTRRTFKLFVYDLCWFWLILVDLSSGVHSREIPVNVAPSENIANEITIYDGLNGQGSSLSITFLSDETCATLPRGWSSKISSVELNQVQCIKLFDNNNCEEGSAAGTGTAVIRIQNEGIGTKNLEDIISTQFIVRAIQKCSNNDQTEFIFGSSQSTTGLKSFFHQQQKRRLISSSTVTLYEFANSEGTQIQLRTDYCINVPVELNNNIASVDTHSSCVKLYDEDDCNGESVQIQPNDPNASNLHFWNFIDRTSSIGPCLEFQQTGLQVINYLRISHDSPALYLNETLNIAAQQEAESLVRQAELPGIDTFLESGELLHVISIPTGLTSTHSLRTIQIQIIKDAINVWYNNKINYDPMNPVSSTFTQLVWKSSNQIGIGLGIYERKAVVLTKFRPVGNIDGYFTENVTIR